MTLNHQAPKEEGDPPERVRCPVCERVVARFKDGRLVVHTGRDGKFCFGEVKE